MLNLYHLKYFHDAALGSSLSASARTNRISHSAVSQAIRALEKTLGAELLVHQKRSFRLSPAGEALVARCSSLFSEMDRLREETAGASSGVRGTLSLAASHSVAAAVLPRGLGAFSAKHPEVRVRFQAGNALRVRELLRSREAELAVALDDPALAEFPRQVWRRGKFVLAARAPGVGNRSSGAKPRDYRTAEYLVGDRGEEVARLRRAYAAKVGRPLPVKMEVQSWEVLAALAREGLGWALIPDFLVTKASGLVVVGRELGAHPYELCVFWRAGAEPGPAARAWMHDHRCSE